MAGSSRKTGNESVSDIDPGGTHPAPDKTGPAEEKHVEHKVETGDRNKMPKPGKTPKS